MRDAVFPAGMVIVLSLAVVVVMVRGPVVDADNAARTATYEAGSVLIKWDVACKGP